jgi:hypothetical protein
LGIDTHGQEALLSEAWARSTDNIPRVNYMEAVWRFKAGDCTPIPIIPGSYARTAVHASLDLDLDEEETRQDGLPLLMYRNKPGEHLCMVNALTSALHYLGYQEIAKRIVRDLEQESFMGVNFVDCFMSRVVNKNLVPYSMKLVRNDKRNRYDPKDTSRQECKESDSSAQHNRLVLGKLKGKKGGINHAVAFVNDVLIFDANHSRAMPLTAESLDVACDGTGYHSLYWSYRLVTIKRSRSG